MAEPGSFLRYVITAYVVLATGAVGAALVAGLADGLAPGASDGCAFHVGAALAGSAEFFRTHVAPGCTDLSLSGARATLGVDAAFALVYGPASALLLAWLWPRAWRVSSFVSARAVGIALPLVTASLDLLENAFVAAGLSDAGGRLALSNGFAVPAGVVGWWKWTFAVATAVAVGASVAGAVANLRTPRVVSGPPHPPGGAPRNDTGICLSGAGMRSAGFALGALRALERRGVPARARWVSGAAGGAYAAAAWFVARAGAAGAPVLDPPKGAPDLVRYVRSHRRYLGSGRGGRPATVLVGILCAAADLLVLAALVCLVAWPLGRLSSSWIVGPELAGGEVPARLWSPGAAGVGMATVLVLASLLLWDPARRRVLRSAGALLTGAFALAAALVAVPHLAASPPAAGVWGVVAAAAVVPLLLIRRLTAVALALPAASLFVWVAVESARGTAGPRAYAALAAAMVLFCVAVDARSWSLFRLRYLRLRTALATTRERRKRARGAPEVAGLYPASLASEPEWPDLRSLGGPQLVVCAAASGEDVAFSTEAAGSETYLGRLRDPGRWGPRLGSLSAAAAVSGASAAPRAGVWIPNPRLEASPHPLKRARVTYLLKEVFGVFDEADPYLYAGAPAPSAALVELIRRRCRWIFCLDGDASAASLEQAQAVALAECGVEIDVDTSPLETGERAVAAGIVRYHSCGGVGRDDCETGLLFYGCAVAASGAPVGRLSLSLRDGLGADDFDNLVRLGEWVGRSVALEYERLPQALAAADASALAGSPALTEAYERLTGHFSRR